MTKAKTKIFIIVLILALVPPALADEGLWPFNMPPADMLKAKYKFNISKAWLDHLMLSSVRFGSASGAFVSPDGLVLTNHHVGRGAIQNLSTKDRDLIKTGFYARTRAEELKCSGLELMVLQEIEDVTSRVLAAEKPEMTPAQAAGVRDKAIAALEQEASEKTGLRATVVNLYSGGLYHLYKYKVYTDVRLVFAPEFAMAFFGGDPDNFTYPRYDLDISLFRIYENDKPLSSKNYLKWNTTGLKEGDFIVASGNPGTTGRLLTLAQLEFLRSVNYPFSITNYERRRSLLQDYGKRGSEYARQAQGALFSVENSLKATKGYLAGLQDEKLMDSKAQEEQTFRDTVRKNPDLDRECGKAWDEIASAEKTYASFFKAYSFFERATGFNTTYFSTARTLVRLAMEKARTNEDRLREYREAALPSLIRRTLAATPIYDELEIANLTNSLIELQKECGDYQEVKWLFAGRLAEDVARDFVDRTRLKDPEVRKKYIEGSVDAINVSDDPMIKLALLVDPISRGLRKRYENEVESVLTKDGALIARALFRLKGTSVPPDATSSPRFSFGAVRGYTENGVKIPFFTTFSGLYDRAAKFGNKPPYDLSPSFVSRKQTIKLNTPLNFVATCDSIGGNSGSPVVNRNGEFSGVLFDGNIQSLPAMFLYTDAQNRSVMVHSQGIIEALTKVYNARPLVDELLGRKGK
jgi:hypothetical protein